MTKNEQEQETFTIDVTPVGMKTPEGVARVNEALRAKEDATYNVANQTVHFLRACGNLVESALVGDDDAKEQYEELQDAVKQYQAATEAFLQALVGR